MRYLNISKLLKHIFIYSAFIRNIALIIFVVSFIVFSPTKVAAEMIDISNIVVEGNKRIETNTILNLTELESGKSYEYAKINSALQRLTKSTFFKTVDIVIVEQNVIIKVSEHPSINTISFEGNSILKDENLFEIITSQQRQTLLAAKIEHDAEKIAKIYFSKGHISAQITPKIIQRDNNRVDLVFEIIEDRITEIEKITFVGNRLFSDTRLRGVLATKQAGVFRRLISSDTFIEDRLNLDKQNLRDFYINRGYVDFEILSHSVELTRSKDAFLLTFTVKEGQKYNFGQINIVTNENDINLNEYVDLNLIRENKKYDSRKLEKLIQKIDRKLSDNGLNFVKASPNISRDDNNLLINVDINLIRGKRILVERIDIIGNSTTLDEVIRHKFDFAEGDGFNTGKIQKATDHIRALGFFSTVDVKTKQGSTADQIVIIVNLVEKPTGSLGIGAGYNSSDGSVFTLNLNERNFLGRGQTVGFGLSNSSDKKELSLSIADPTFLSRDIYLGVSLGNSSASPASLPLQTDKMYFAPSIGYPLSRDSSIMLTYKVEKDEIKLSTAGISASPIIKADVGDTVKSGIILAYKFDKTNSIIAPTSGFKIGINQEINGLFGDINYSKTSINLKTYTAIFNDDIILSSAVNAGAIFGSDSTISNRFSLGGDKLRGFQNYGIGPRDTNFTATNSNGDPLGGKMFAAANIEASFPIGIPEEYGIFGGVFLDAGSVWELDNVLSDSSKIVDDSAKIRAAAGVSLFWDTAIGPLRFNFSRPLQKEIYDVTENFRFTVDTRF